MLYRAIWIKFKVLLFHAIYQIQEHTLHLSLQLHFYIKQHSSVLEKGWSLVIWVWKKWIGQVSALDNYGKMPLCTWILRNLHRICVSTGQNLSRHFLNVAVFSFLKENKHIFPFYAMNHKLNYVYFKCINFFFLTRIHTGLRAKFKQSKVEKKKN